MRKLSKIITYCFGLAAGLASLAHAHDTHMAQYIANEGVLVTSGDHEHPTKLLFDPFFHNDYGAYQLAPEEMRSAMMKGEAPFDDIAALFISHAHGDHFDADDVNTYLSTHQNVRLFAPLQAVEAMQKAESWDESNELRITAIALERGEPAMKIVLTGRDEAEIAAITTVRIPHAGWPGRADVQNMVYRVEIHDGATVMHMGDADPNDDHYAPYGDVWDAARTHMAFPPYWFYGSDAGRAILDERLNIQSAVGVHVPVSVPGGLSTLRAQGMGDYFSIPGETRSIFVPVEQE